MEDRHRLELIELRASISDSIERACSCGAAQIQAHLETALMAADSELGCPADPTAEQFEAYLHRIASDYLSLTRPPLIDGGPAMLPGRDLHVVNGTCS